MAISTVYKSTDGNAPVLNGASGGGSLANLLKKCLVEGYGEKVAAGWTLEHSNIAGTIIALRGNTLAGTGFFLQVNDSASNYAAFRGYESMTAFDTGVLPFPFTSGISIQKSYTADTTVRRWALVATDTIFYLFIYTFAPATGAINVTRSPSGNGHVDMFVFGDLLKFQDEGFNCCLGYGYNRYGGGTVPGEIYGFTRLLSSPTGGASLWAARKRDGAIPAANCELGLNRGGPMYQSSGYANMYYLVGAPYTPGSLIIAKTLLTDPSPFLFRGQLPGIYVIGHSATNFLSMTFSLITEGGKTFLVVPISGAYDSTRFTEFCLLVEIGEWS